MTYSVPKEYLSFIAAHIEAYDFIILTMTYNESHYIFTLNDEILQDDYEHLSENYQLEIV